MDTDGRAGFADLLRTLRADAGLSLADLGTAAHIARGYIHHLEHGRCWIPGPPLTAAHTVHS